MYTDTHAHLNFRAFNDDLEQVILSAVTAGVEKMVIPGAKLDSSKKAAEIAQSHDNCYAAVGIHPHHIEAFASGIREEIIAEFERIARMDKVVAIGETGLDYHTYKGYPTINRETKRLQTELFLLHLEMAKKYRLPLIIHTRDAFPDMLHLLEAYEIGKHRMKGVFHCFSGNRSQLEKVLDMGFLVGFDGNITYEENRHLRDMAKNTPEDKILLETDSPYLTPVPYRGKRNEPKHLVLVAESVSAIYNKTREEIGRQTSINARGLFSF